LSSGKRGVLRKHVVISKRAVIPANAGTQLTDAAGWVPAFAGMTSLVSADR
jgi:hypothetical protein